MKTIAVLLTVFNRREKTLTCLKQLYSQIPIEGYKIDVFLTNDKCTDGTAESIYQNYPQVHIINGNGNLFWNRGMYTAWKEAAQYKYDFYLWLNDDVELKANAIRHILSCSNIKNDKCIITGLISSTDGTITTYGGRKNRIKVQMNGTMQEVDCMHGNFVLIPQIVFNKIGFNDPYYNHAYGDHDYSLTAKSHGIKTFTTKEFVGYCNIDTKIPKCFRPDIPLKERWKILHTPLAYAKPNEIFYFEKKHHNIVTASIRYCMVYLRCLFPKMWL